MIQIILRDLSPLLYPLPTLSGNRSLREYNAMPYHEIDIFTAMRAWDPQMPRLYRLTADLDFVAKEVESVNCAFRRRVLRRPRADLSAFQGLRTSRKGCPLSVSPSRYAFPYSLP